MRSRRTIRSESRSPRRGWQDRRNGEDRPRGEPYGVKAVRLGEVGKIDATARIDPAGQTQAQFRQLSHTHPLGARGSSNGSNAAGALARTRFGKMRVHDAPAAGVLAEHHRRAGDELAPAEGYPIAFGAAMAPHHRHV